MQLQYSGMKRNLPAMSNKGGECDEIINLRPDNGSLRGIGKPNVNAAKFYLNGTGYFPDDCIRVPANLNVLIVYSKLTNHLSYIPSTEVSAAPIGIFTFDTGELFSHFASLGGTVIAFTDKRAIYLQYAEGIIKVMPELEMLILQVGESLESKAISTEVDAPWFYGGNTMTPLKIYPQYFEQILTNFITKYSESREEGYFFGNVTLMFAYKMFDGTYIKHSGTYVWNVCGDKPNIKATEVSANVTKYTMTKYVSYPIVHYDAINAAQTETLQKYADLGLIKSLSVFMTPEQSGWDIFEGNIFKWTFPDPETGFVYPPFSNSYLNKVSDSTSFYKVADIDIATVLTRLQGTGRREHEVLLNDNQLEDIETNEVLPVDNFSHHQLLAKTDYTYNSRLHLGDIKVSAGLPEYLFIGWKSYAIHPLASILEYPMAEGTFNEFNYVNTYFNSSTHKLTDSELNSFEFYIYAEIKINDDIYATIRQIDKTKLRLFTEDKVATSIFVRPFPAYFDMRASKVAILIKETNSSVYKLMKIVNDTNLPDSVFTLTAHSFHNLASHKKTPTDGDLFLPYQLQIPDDLTAYNALTTFAPKTDRCVMWTETNRIQASGVGNAYAFPAKNSYRIGNLETVVRAMIASLTPITELQYGQFPLFVYSSDGIFTLQQGDGGEVLYSRIVPFSTDIIQSGTKPFNVASNLICYIGLDGIVLISGREKKVISDALVGGRMFGPADLSTHLDTNLTKYEFQTDNIDIATLFLSTGKLLATYDWHYNEILFTISEGTLTYILAYNLASDTWTKRFYLESEGNYYLNDVKDNHGIIKKFDTTLNVYTASFIKFIGMESTTGVAKPFLIQTRPFSLGSGIMTGIDRVVQRCTNLLASTETPSYLFLYGTNELHENADYRGWRLIAETSNKSSVHESIMAKVQSGTYKYFVIVLKGISNGSHSTVEQMDLDIKLKYQRKLR